ncbi:MAG TPA: TlpA disulfide reductase family protein [Blastocatellia bacterium]|nr:TlpA disulfide reductase family protein [Blastocatellia bacterium]
MKELYSRYHNKKYQNGGLEVIGVSIDTDKKAFSVMVAAKKIPWPQILDGRSGDGPVARLFNLRGTPMLYLIDGEGNIAGKSHSAEEIESLLAGKFK